MNKKIVIFITVLFSISWLFLAFFGFLFVNSRIENLKLKNSLAFSEQKIKSLSTESALYQKLKTERDKWEERALDYLQWQYMLKEQVRGANQRLAQDIGKIKELKKNEGLLNLLYYNLGLNYVLAKDFKSAIQAFEKALKFLPEDALSCYNLGLLYSTYRQDNKKAIDYYKKYLELAPDSPQKEEVRERLEALRLKAR